MSRQSATPTDTARPARGFGGVHDPSRFHDGCGVAFVARLDGKPIHETIDRGLVALDRLEHRGATGADALDRRRRRDHDRAPPRLPALARRRDRAPARRAARPRAPRRRDVLPAPRARRLRARPGADLRARRRGRPHGRSAGATSRSTRPRAASWRARPRRRSASSSSPPARSADEDDVRAQRCSSIRRRAERELGADGSPSRACPAGRIVYKGMLTAPQLPQFYPDLRDMTTAQHASRSSTRASRPTPRRAGSSRSRCG